jgi:hypothetical protein
MSKIACYAGFKRKTYPAFFAIEDFDMDLFEATAKKQKAAAYLRMSTEHQK